MHLVKLKPRKGELFHIGQKDLQSTDTVIHSDTLFSALANNYWKLYGGHIDNLIRAVQESKIRLSSAFPYLEIWRGSNLNGTILFLPKPFEKMPLDDAGAQLSSERSKLLKRIKFISLNVWKRWNAEKRVFFSKALVLDEHFLIDENDYATLGISNAPETAISAVIAKVKIIGEQEEQRVTLDRITNKSDTFYTTSINFPQSLYYVIKQEMRFNTNSGFYFFMDCNDADERFHAAIRLLADEGIGGERSSGKGFFDSVEIMPEDGLLEELNNLPSDKMAIIHASLSLVFPRESELDFFQNYQLVERKGFIYSSGGKSYRRRSVRMLEEGSTFSEAVKGNIAAVTPATFENHPVYRYGIAFTIPLRCE